MSAIHQRTNADATETQNGYFSQNSSCFLALHLYDLLRMRRSLHALQPGCREALFGGRLPTHQFHIRLRRLLLHAPRGRIDQVGEAAMKQMTFPLHLYELYDRTFEDCYADVSMNVPDDFDTKYPGPDQVSLHEITIQKDTREYLESTFDTDIPKLIKRIGNDMGGTHMYDALVEWYGESITQEAFDKWYPS